MKMNNHIYYASILDSLQIWRDETILKTQEIKPKRYYNENREKTKNAKRYNGDNSPVKQNGN